MSTLFNNYAEYYDNFYSDKNYISESRYLYKILKNNKISEGKILDFGCGTGTHAILLNKYNYNVLGIDISSKMISIAKNKIKNNQYKNIEFKKANIKYLNLKKKFNAVISMFHVFSYQTETSEIKNFLEKAYNHLHKKGILIFDFWYGPGIILSKQIRREKKIKIKNTYLKRISEPKINYSKNIVNVKISVNSLSAGKSKKLITENHTMRYFFEPEIEYYLSNHGFELISLNKSFTNQKPDNDDWNAIIVAKKK